MIRIPAALGACVAVIATVTCALTVQPAKAQQDDGAQVRQALDLRRSEFELATSDNDAAAMSRLYTPNALLFPPGADTVRGRDAIQGYFDHPRDYEIQHDVVELEGRGETVYEIGRWTQTTKEGGEVIGGGWYFWVWRRQRDGSWLVDRDLWSSTPVPRRDGH
jgi:ketosteroid isomerase-like protein